MTLAPMLARALYGRPDDELGSAKSAAIRILAALRSDPEVLTALAEALHRRLDNELCLTEGRDGLDEHDMPDTWWTLQAAALLDALLGPKP